MQTETAPGPDLARRRGRRRTVVVLFGRSLVVSTLLIVGYFVLPIRASPEDGWAFTELVLGLLACAGLFAWQVRGILQSTYPTIKAVSALMVSVPLFLVVFAATYYVMGVSVPGSFSEPMTRLDSAYFTVTVFTTVGFGDIVGVSEVARAVLTVQMMGDVVLVGLIAKIVVGAVTEARARGRGSSGNDAG